MDKTKESLDEAIRELKDDLRNRTTETVPGEILSDIRDHWFAVLKKAGEYVVPGTIALTVSGFVICSYHFLQRGVPLASLSSAQLVTAGAIYTALTTLSIGLGFITSGLRLRKMLASWAFSTAFVHTVFGIYSARAGFAATAYFTTIMVVLGATMARSLRRLIGPSVDERVDQYVAEATAKAKGQDVVPPAPRKSKKEKTEVAPSGYEIFGATWALTILVFSAAVYPRLPAGLGGGAPRPVDLLWEKLPEGDEQGLLGGGAAQRCLFEVHSDSSYLYLLSIDPTSDKLCLPPQTFFTAPLRLDDRTPRYVVLPRSRIRLTSYAPKWRE